jgi:hypothetical protein
MRTLAPERGSCLRDAEGHWRPYLLTYKELREELATSTGERRRVVVREAMYRMQVTHVYFPPELLAF